jgi:hypothetical protein
MRGLQLSAAGAIPLPGRQLVGSGLIPIVWYALRSAKEQMYARCCKFRAKQWNWFIASHLAR